MRGRLQPLPNRKGRIVDRMGHLHDCETSNFAKVRASSTTDCLSAVISWSTQINCHLISFPGFVVAETCGLSHGLGLQRYKLSTFLMCFDHQHHCDR